MKVLATIAAAVKRSRLLDGRQPVCGKDLFQQ